MATFFNQASISFNGFVTNSNVTSGEVLDVLTATKSAISSSYRQGGGVVYAISILNSGAVPISGITVTDDLGSYTATSGEVTPLDYTQDSVRLYVNGTLVASPTVTVGPPLVFSGITIPAGGVALILYEASANAYAPLASGATISNTATVEATAPCVEGPITASASVGAADFTSLSIAKSVCPDAVSSCEEITYTFVIQNAGNTPVVATDNLTVSDTFAPALSNITVTLDGAPLTEGVGYTYDEATGVFATLPGQITVPAATFVQDPVTGIVTTTPGTTVLTVSGTV